MKSDLAQTSAPEVATPSDETLVVLREMAELLIAIHNLQNEQLHVLNRIETQMP